MRCLLTLFSASLLLVTAEARGAFFAINEPERRDMVFDQNDVLYVSISNGTIARFNAKTNTLLSPWTIGGNPAGIDISPGLGLLAVGDTQIQGNTIRFHLVNRVTGVDTPFSFGRENFEGGTYTVAWGSDNRLLFSGDGGGIRIYDRVAGHISTVAFHGQNSSLTANADRKIIGQGETNSSGGAIWAYDVQSGAFEGTINTNDFVNDIAVDLDGDKFVVPGGHGGKVYNYAGGTFVKQGTIGGAPGGHTPLGAVFSPLYGVLFTAENAQNNQDFGVRVYDPNTLSYVATIDAYNFQSSGAIPLQNGHLKISPDGKYLAAMVQGGVRVYDVSAFVPEPSALITIAGVCFLLRRRRSDRG